MDLYAKIYLYSSATKTQVDALLSQLTADLTSLDWSVMRNDDFNAEKSLQFPDGFLFFPYLIELEPVASSDQEIYLSEIGNLLNKLWKEGISAIIAADFENELPKKGGYKSWAIPFPHA